MEFHLGHATREPEISDLFTATFSDSEGAGEGEIIGRLVRDLMQTTPESDLYVCCAYDGKTLVGCIFFSRLTYEMDARAVFIMSPVAVKTDRQGRKIGQKLIAFGLGGLREQGVDFAVTYGDPNFYSKTGFRQITTEFAAAPLRLNMPQGWLGQSLSGKDAAPLAGPSQCVAALNKPALW